MTKTISEQTKRIAKAGAAKMTAQGYTYKLFPFSTVAGAVKKADGTTYKVNTHTVTCGCPFHKDNGYCKHLEWLSDELAYEAAALARCEEYDLAKLDGVAA